MDNMMESAMDSALERAIESLIQSAIANATQNAIEDAQDGSNAHYQGEYCFVCSKPATRGCSHCEDSPEYEKIPPAAVYYCSEYCQDVDSQRHSNDCEVLLCRRDLFRAAALLRAIVNMTTSQDAVGVMTDIYPYVHELLLCSGICKDVRETSVVTDAQVNDDGQNPTGPYFLYKATMANGDEWALDIVEGDREDRIVPWAEAQTNCYWGAYCHYPLGTSRDLISGEECGVLDDQIELWYDKTGAPLYHILDGPGDGYVRSSLELLQQLEDKLSRVDERPPRVMEEVEREFMYQLAPQQFARPLTNSDWDQSDDETISMPDTATAPPHIESPEDIQEETGNTTQAVKEDNPCSPSSPNGSTRDCSSTGPSAANSPIDTQHILETIKRLQELAILPPAPITATEPPIEYPDDTPAIKDPSNRYQIQPVPGKGLGMIASTKLPVGTRILGEGTIFDCPPSGSMNLTTLNKILALSVTAAERKAFFSLANAYKVDPERLPRAIGIIKTNALGIAPANLNDPHDPTAAIFLTASRINHSCRPNAIGLFNPIVKRLMIHAIRDIEAGEEITLSYVDPLDDYDDRQATLMARYGFRCTCERCNVTPEEQDVRRSRAVKISMWMIGISDLDAIKEDPLKCLRRAEEMLKLYREEGLGEGLLVPVVYQEALLIAAYHGDKARARVFARRCYEARVLMAGADNPLAEADLRMSEQPSTHPQYGKTNQWETKVKRIPKGLSEEDFDKWLWRK